MIKSENYASMNSLQQFSLLTVILLFLNSCTSESQSSNTFSYTNDYIDILKDEEEAELNGTLSQLEDSIGSQIVIITDTLAGEAIEEYSLRKAREFGAGRAGYNDGIVITIAPKDRMTRIEVGYGLECIISDSIASIIIETKMIPHFKNEKYYDGLYAAVDDIRNRLYLKQSEIGYCESNPGFNGENPI
jgi:uncharacterized protein